MGAPATNLALRGGALLRLAEPICAALADAPYTTPPGGSVSAKAVLEALLQSTSCQKPASSAPDEEETMARAATRDFFLCCVALASADGEESPYVYWIPKDLRRAGWSALERLADALSMRGEGELVRTLLPDVVPLLKAVINESCIDTEADEILVSSTKAPVVYAIMAAHQFRWLISQIRFPHLGKFCSLIIPCALTALDHWSPEVKGPGMAAFIHLANNANSAELGWYEVPILDACSHNIAASDELWDRVVEMSVLLLSCIQRANPRSPWYDQILNEMLGHLERQPSNKERRVAWLRHIEPVLNAMGLFLLAYFRRIFSLLFQWMHADDDETLILVLERTFTIIKLTWARRSPFIPRLIDELTLVYKEAAMKEREAIHSRILQIFTLLRKCHATQLETAWEKHKDDPDLASIDSLTI